MKLKIDTRAVLEFSKTADLDVATDEAFFQHLYQAARDYTYAKEEAERLLVVIEQCVSDTRTRGRSFYSIGDKGTELDKAVETRERAERLFHILCQVKGIEVEA